MIPVADELDEREQADSETDHDRSDAHPQFELREEAVESGPYAGGCAQESCGQCFELMFVHIRVPRS